MENEQIMPEVRMLAPHDPLPGGHSIVVMQRLDEDAPRETMIELIVTNPDGSEETSLAASLDAALTTATERAAQEGLDIIWRIDRTGGPLEQQVLARHGDHSFPGAPLDDSDLEDGERGADMRDRGNDGAPRRF